LYDVVHTIDAVDYHIDQANDPPGPAYSLDPNVVIGQERDLVMPLPLLPMLMLMFLLLSTFPLPLLVV